MKRIVILAMLLMTGGFVRAHDFVVTLDGQKVYFNIKSEKNRTVELTYKGSIADGLPTDYAGELTIPAKVRHNNTVYSVVGIGAKAFSGADKLTGVVMPTGLTTIGDFAFEGCVALSKIIFPGNSVRFGQGVFFKCDKIQHVSFGSDWKEVNLQMFRWSDSLATLVIPAKLERIQNMKSLKHLQGISVDVNNDRFSAIDGVLYDKAHETLYGCPRAYKGCLRVSEGTKRVMAGALVDCKRITRVDLPASLEAMSFREFSRMDGLEEIIFRGDAPVMTAGKGGEEVFLLQVANPEVKVVVPKDAVKAYEAELAQERGEYVELEGEAVAFVEMDELPKRKNVVGVKNFSKYEQLK